MKKSVLVDKSEYDYEQSMLLNLQRKNERAQAAELEQNAFKKQPDIV